jgi:hypothetical protein
LTEPTSEKSAPGPDVTADFLRDGADSADRDASDNEIGALHRLHTGVGDLGLAKAKLAKALTNLGGGVSDNDLSIGLTRLDGPGQ